MAPRVVSAFAALLLARGCRDYSVSAPVTEAIRLREVSREIPGVKSRSASDQRGTPSVSRSGFHTSTDIARERGKICATSFPKCPLLYRQLSEGRRTCGGLSCPSEKRRPMLSAHITSFLKLIGAQLERLRAGYAAFITSTTSNAELRIFYRFSSPTAKLSRKPINSRAKLPATSRAMI